MGGTFADPVVYWYSLGVRALQQRPLSSNLSWRFVGAVHGIDTGIWEHYGYYQSGEPVPSETDQALYWNQCQHGSWYFLPWHRGYLWSIEGLLRAAIVDLGGPSDWAMPYWSYSDTSDPKARTLPPAFAQLTMPDGSPNALYVKERYGNGSLPITIPARDASLLALMSRTYTTAGQLPGFGGGKTGFSHSGREAGTLESVPHNVVHVDIGGGTGDGPGLMSDPDTAGLDPIFWLHHANIDRLWAAWNAQGRTNPTDPAWLNGPLDRKFVVPAPDGSAYYYTPADMLDTGASTLDYTYDDLGEAARAVLVSRVLPGREVAMMAQSKAASLMGANSAKVAVAGPHTQTQVRLDTSAMQRVKRARHESLARASTFGAIADADVSPNQHVLLKLENIRAARDDSIIDVYLNLPEGADPGQREDLLAGTVGLFGVRKASLADQPHGGMGVSQVFDITHIVENLADQGQLDDNAVSVHLVPRRPVDDANITVERVSLYYQEGQGE